MADSKYSLPKGFEDATPVEQDYKLPPGWEDAKKLKDARYKDPVTATSEKVAPLAGRLISESLPFIGSFAGPEGTAAGVFAKQFMQSLKPELLGQGPQSVGDMGWDMTKELLTNNLIPAGIGKTLGAVAKGVNNLTPQAALAYKLRNFPAVREGVIKNISTQILDRPWSPAGSEILEKGAAEASQNLEGLTKEIKLQSLLHPPTTSMNPASGVISTVQHPNVMGAIQHLEDVFGRNRVGQMMTKLNKEVQMGTSVSRTQTYNDIANTVLSDITHVRNAKLAASSDFVDELAYHKVVNSAFDPATGKISGAKMLQEMSGKSNEIYNEALDAGTQATLSEFADTLKWLEGKNTTDRIINYSKGKLIWSATALASLGAKEIGILGAAGAGGALGTNKILEKLMENPQTVQLVTQAIQTPSTSPMAGHLIDAIKIATRAGGDSITALSER